MRLKLFPLLIAALLCAACHRNEAPQAVVGATLIDGRSRPPVANAVILIQGSKIAALGPRNEIQLPPGTIVFQARGRFIFPLDPAEPLTVGGNADLQITGTNPALDPDYAKSSFGRMKEGRWVEYPH